MPSWTRSRMSWLATTPGNRLVMPASSTAVARSVCGGLLDASMAHTPLRKPGGEGRPPRAAPGAPAVPGGHGPEPGADGPPACPFRGRNAAIAALFWPCLPIPVLQRRLTAFDVARQSNARRCFGETIRGCDGTPSRSQPGPRTGPAPGRSPARGDSAAPLTGGEGRSARHPWGQEVLTVTLPSMMSCLALFTASTTSVMAWYFGLVSEKPTPSVFRSPRMVPLSGLPSWTDLASS